MDLPAHTQGIEVYYDGCCGMCCRFAEWLDRQPRAFPVEFMAYQSPRAMSVFPGLAALDPSKAMVVRTREGGVYRGAEAWVWSLYSSLPHQDLARRLSGPCLLPVADKACRLLAANRHRLSAWFFSGKDDDLMARLHEMESPSCGDGCEVSEPAPEGPSKDE